MDQENIEQFLKAQGLTDQQLIEELTDHLLAKMEASPNPLDSLQEIMEEVWPTPDLEQLQKLAFTYANPKLYFMKKLAVIVGLFASITFLAGALFKFFHLAGTPQVIMIGYLLVGLFVLPYFWWKQYHYSLIDRAMGLGNYFNLGMCLSGFLASEFMLAGIYISLFIHLQPLGLNLSFVSAFFLLFYIPMYWYRQYRLWSTR